MMPKLDLQSQLLQAGWAGNNVTCEDDLSSVSTLYVEGIPSSITTIKELRQFFSKTDEITFCQVFFSSDHAPKIFDLSTADWFNFFRYIQVN